MKILLKNIRIPIENDGYDEYLKLASQKLQVAVDQIKIFKILSKSIDILSKEQFFYDLSVVVTIIGYFENQKNFSIYTEEKEAENKRAKTKERPIIVGFGPAGMFAALALIDYGLKPIIFERGKKIDERSVDVQQFIKQNILNTESNIQFGEGGAGSYSDGKLFSRRENNTSSVNRVLQTFIQFGAPEEIEYISKPHLGTDVLCKIVRNIRKYILEKGGEISYCAKMTDILISGGKASGIIINNEKEYLSSSIYLALGHSARDTVKMLHDKGVALEQRPISVGVRIEHPVETINIMRYGYKYHNFNTLGAATYSLNYTNQKIQVSNQH